MPWSNTKPGRSVPYTLQQACFKRDNWTCQQCGYQGRQHKGDLHADHIINRAEGGTNTLANLETKCPPCHEQKTRAEQARGTARRAGTRPQPRHPSDITT